MTEISISAKTISNLLNRIHLGGLVEECVLTISEGIGKIQCVDLSNSVFFSMSAKIKMPDMEIGLNSLSVICRFLQSAGDEDVTILFKEKWMILKRKGMGTLKLLLTEPGQISTSIPNKDASKKMLDGDFVSCKYTKTVIDKFSYYMGLLGGQGVVLSVDENRSVYLQSVKTESQQFKVKVGTAGESTGAFSLELVAANLFKVSQCVVDVEDVEMMLAKDRPLIIKINDKNFWAISPISQ